MVRVRNAELDPARGVYATHIEITGRGELCAIYVVTPVVRIITFMNTTAIGADLALKLAWYPPAEDVDYVTADSFIAAVEVACAWEATDVERLRHDLRAS